MTDAAWRTPDAGLLRAYQLVLLTRTVDERLWALSRQGRAGFVLTARGHEVAQIGSALALEAGRDWAWPYYRDLGVGLSLGVTPFEIFLGALAKGDDPHSGGRQLTAHFSDPERRIGSISSEVAGHVTHAVGSAYASRVLGDDSVAVCWFGDGASSEGAVHEAMNVAAVAGLPVVFFCENNGYAISVPLSLQMAAPVAARAAGYGFPGLTVDGTDIDAVNATTSAAVSRARSGGGPSLIEAVVPRLVPHSSQDDEKYRSDEDRAEAAERDPLPRLEKYLMARGLLDEAGVTRAQRAAREQVQSDLERALAAPDPEPERARRWLYAGDAPFGPAPKGAIP